MTEAPNRPVKTRDIHNHHMDSTAWDEFDFRDDDIVIATYAKSGTTWTQQIVGQLLSNGDPTLPVADRSPWVDLRIPGKAMLLPMLARQRERRFLKTHLPVDAIVFSRRAKYIYVARDGRDVVWSLHNHHASFTPEALALINDTPGRVGPALEAADPDIRRYWHRWLCEDGAPFWSFWENVRSWWAIRQLPNVLMLHYEDLKRDLPGEMRRVAAFLGIAVDEARFPAMVEHCTFDWMRAHGDTVVPLGGAIWRDGANSFLNRGTNGRWRDVLTTGEARAYEGRALAELGPACAQWLANGAGERRAAA